MRRLAISDIHGCALTLKALLEQVGFSRDDELFLLGDYIDRGPDSKGVIDLILSLKEQGHRLHCLLGNHEALMLSAMGGLANEHQVWLDNGGEATMRSFGLGPAASPRLIPQPYRDFLGRLEWYYETDGYILVHAGLDFRAARPLEAGPAMIWSRSWYSQIDLEWLQGRVVVHGHTPTPRPLIVKQLKKLDVVPALDIDAGCVFKGNYFKYLCAFDLDSRQLYFQKNIETDA